MTTDHPASRTVELWIRGCTSPAPDSNQERALDTLEQLDERGVVEGVTVGVWGDTFESSSLSEQVSQLERIQSRLEAFEAWAAENDRRLEPCFRRRQTHSQLTGANREVWRLPAVALAEFDGDDLVHVAPCRDGDRTVDIFDRLEVLESGTGSETVVRFDGNRGNPRETGDGDRTEPRTERDEFAGPRVGNPYGTR
ncbi:hypothetical protein D8Y22_19065 [Salinadaptatus halalkaliphilus]|uniref:Uncharacterized protein n=1 Tax=Salinadaptatus halalkaliphilus TaxID=2419781 RepID=A0A4S3TH84_9EURY|nr:HTH domain-containing protein [Salinadaptatus halalkaliphilus]THE63266.1 hypothetical protein D8Y22_19065 [Salinadaptatus halalkaliphilus]